MIRKKILKAVQVSVMILFYSNVVAAGNYDHTIEDNGIELSWRVADDQLHVKVSAETTGWVGVGFNPTEQMKGANYIVGYVKEGEVVVHDHYGDEKWNHSEDRVLGGTNDLTNIGGQQTENRTTLEYSLALDSGDVYDGVIIPQGKTVVLLAYGGNRDSLRAMHRYRTTLTVNLATGEHE